MSDDGLAVTTGEWVAGPGPEAWAAAWALLKAV